MDAQFLNAKLLSPVSKSAVDNVREALEHFELSVVSRQYKFGVLYAPPGGTCSLLIAANSEDAMYEAKDGSAAFDAFLDLLGERVQLKDFAKFKGGLDTRNGTTG